MTARAADMRMPDNEEVKETFSHIARSIRDAYPYFSYLHVPEPRVAGITDRDANQEESNDFLKHIWLEGMFWSRFGLNTKHY
jgi:NADPH2 dehydrogenase